MDRADLRPSTAHQVEEHLSLETIVPLFLQTKQQRTCRVLQGSHPGHLRSCIAGFSEAASFFAAGTRGDDDLRTLNAHEPEVSVLAPWSIRDRVQRPERSRRPLPGGDATRKPVSPLDPWIGSGRERGSVLPPNNQTRAQKSQIPKSQIPHFPDKSKKRGKSH